MDSSKVVRSSCAVDSEAAVTGAVDSNKEVRQRSESSSKVEVGEVEVSGAVDSSKVVDSKTEVRGKQ